MAASRVFRWRRNLCSLQRRTARLLKLDDIRDGQARGAVVPRASLPAHVSAAPPRRTRKGGSSVAQDDSVRLLVARRGDRAYAYINRCPHMRLPLDWIPDEFISRDGAYLECATHGAQFEVETGHCVFGPCLDKRLERVHVDIDPEGYVVAVSESEPSS